MQLEFTPTCYTLDMKLSDGNSAVYVNKKTGKPVISFRGTNPKNLKDLNADRHIFLYTEKNSDRFKSSHIKYKMLLQNIVILKLSSVIV